MSDTVSGNGSIKNSSITSMDGAAAASSSAAAASSRKQEQQQQQQQQQKQPQKKGGGGGNVFSLSCGASVLTALYLSTSCLNLYRLMYPMSAVDVSAVPSDRFVRPLWAAAGSMRMRVYLSAKRRFAADFLSAKEVGGRKRSGNSSSSRTTGTAGTAVELLWDEEVHSPAFSKSFLLTTLFEEDSSGNSTDGNNCSAADDADSSSSLEEQRQTCTSSSSSSRRRVEDDESYRYAVQWLDNSERVAAERGEGGAVMAAVSAAGQGIESTSFLLAGYQAASKRVKRALAAVRLIRAAQEDDDAAAAASAAVLERTIVPLSPSSKIWSALASNSTVYVHVVLIRTDEGSDVDWPSSESDADDTDDEEYEEKIRAAHRTAQRANAMLSGQVTMVKYDPPHHVQKPARILYYDVLYCIKKALGLTAQHERPPWDMSYSKPAQYGRYAAAAADKAAGVGYPYWKPEVAIKYVNDRAAYPVDMVGASGMPLVRVGRKDAADHPTGIAFLPALHVDEIGMTSEKYIPVNETVTSLPLRVSFDRSDMEHHDAAIARTGTAGGISPARWRLLSHLSNAIEQQRQLGFEQSDIDDVRRLIADTNVTLLGITLLASTLHLLFEFLTFKSEVSFWRSNEDLTGLSVRSLFLDMIGQTVILLFLIEKESSLLMTVPSGIGCLIALWKCQRAAGLRFVPVNKQQQKEKDKQQTKVFWWNSIFRLVGYELKATRLEFHTTTNDGNNDDNDDDNKAKKSSVSTSNSSSNSSSAPAVAPSREETKIRLQALTMESDKIATRTLGSVLLPLVAAYTAYSLVREEHAGWYSWLITSASSAVYALGFVLMTPQLFLNWKLKSVAHLPWRVLVYRSLNTFIDDLFSFIIRMPTMARISCFRDDIVFFVYLYQRWLYPVDANRPVEGGGAAGAGAGNGVSSPQQQQQQQQQSLSSSSSSDAAKIHTKKETKKDQ